MSSKRQRIEAAFAGEFVSPVPVSLWRHFPQLDRDAAALAEAHRAFQVAYDFDFVKLTPSAGYYAEDWGYRITGEYDRFGVSRGAAPVIARPGDWERLRPLPPDRGFLGVQVEAVRRLRDALGPDVPVFQTYFSPLAQAMKLSHGAVFEHLRARPAAVRAGLEVITETHLAFMEANLAAGADGVFFSTQAANRSLCPWEEYEAFGVPYDRRLLERAREKTPLVLLHVHGEDPYFAELFDYPAAALNWHDRRVGPSIAEARRLTPRALVGGLNEQGAVNGADPEAAAAEARDALRQASAGGSAAGFCLGPGCVIATDAPDATIRTVIAAARGYPPDPPGAGTPGPAR